MKTNNNRPYNNNCGFTLVEMMIALFVGGIILIGLSVTFKNQSDSKLIQEDVTEILQNARVARTIISENLRMAGYYDPNAGPQPGTLPYYPLDNNYLQNPGLNPPPPNDLERDSLVVRYYEESPITGGAAAYKTVGFDLYDSTDDADIFLNNLSWLNSNVQGGAHLDAPRLPLINNIDGLEFVYTINDGTTAVNTLTTSPTAAEVDNIQAIQVTMLLRGKFDRTGLGVFDTNTYTSKFGTVWGPFDDGFKRRLFSFTVSRRN